MSGVSRRGFLKASTPSSPGLWSYLAAAGKVAGAPFGANPHALVI